MDQLLQPTSTRDIAGLVHLSHHQVLTELRGLLPADEMNDLESRFDSGDQQHYILPTGTVARFLIKHGRTRARIISELTSGMLS